MRATMSQYTQCHVLDISKAFPLSRKGQKAYYVKLSLWRKFVEYQQFLKQRILIMKINHVYKARLVARMPFWAP
jgi:hypothetical protein